MSDTSDVDRLISRVHVALNSGRDRAVVQVVLDETDALRREVETLREGNRVACGRFEVAERALADLKSAVSHDARDCAESPCVFHEIAASAERAEAIVERVRASRAAYQRWLDVAIDEQTREWLPAIIGALDSMLEGPL